MFQLGIYPGVEYRIMRVLLENKDVFYSQPKATYELKPIYALVPQLERPWPVRVEEQEIPKLVTSNMYNTISALGSVLVAVTGLLLAFAISQAVSLFVIPSRSMEPTLQVGDVLLVDKITPRFVTAHTGDIVLFHPPERLQEIVRINDRDLFVKRVAAQPGDVFAVDGLGNVQVNGGPSPNNLASLCTAEPLRLIERYVQRTPDVTIPPKQVAVLGDCSSVSIDSRVWGLLPMGNIAGRPLIRLWPLERFGPIRPLPSIHNDWSD